MKNLSTAVIVLAMVGVFGFVATSFAGWGRGGGGDCRGQGAGWGPKGFGPAGYQSNLSDEEIDELNKEQQAFFEDTSELRQNLHQKKLELRSELAKKEPDAEKAIAIQKEVSDLKAQLAQKRIRHRIKMQKENPDFFAGRGYGPGRGYGMGRGFHGRGGGCWY